MQGPPHGCGCNGWLRDSQRGGRVPPDRLVPRCSLSLQTQSYLGRSPDTTAATGQAQSSAGSARTTAGTGRTARRRSPNYIVQSARFSFRASYLEIQIDPCPSEQTIKTPVGHKAGPQSPCSSTSETAMWTTFRYRRCPAWVSTSDIRSAAQTRPS